MWYENSFKRNLIDMHIADWNPEFMSRFDPETYAENVSASGVDTAIIYANSCLGICYWPTQAGHMHEGLQGRDIFGETIAACKRRGMKVVAYYNIWNRWEFDHHPDWRMLDSQGKAARVDYGQRYGLCCPNTGYREFVRQQIHDLCSHYTFDGLWIDMIGWFGTTCYCEGCQKTYREETGYELPKDVDFSDPNWVRFIRKRQEWQMKFAQDINETARLCQPKLSVTHQCTSFLNGWQGGASMAFLHQCDYLAGDFYLGPAPEAFICKFLRAASNRKPIEFMVSRCIDLAEHTTTKSKELLTMQAMMAVSHLSAFVFIDAINPVGTLNRALYDTMRTVLDKMDCYLPYMHGSSRQLADVAIYFNPDNVTGEETADTSFMGENMFPLLKSAYTITKTLIDANIAFDVVTPKNQDWLSDYSVVILPQSLMLDEKEVQMFSSYVYNGGNLYVSGCSGLVDGDGNSYADFALADVMGIHYTGKTDWDITYMTPTLLGQPCFAEYSADSPLCIPQKQIMIQADTDTEILATRTMPYAPPRDRDRFSAAISDPPGVMTDEPALTLHGYGKGKAMYVACELETVEHTAQRKVFSDLIQSLLNHRQVLESNAPKPVQINVFERDNGQYLVNVLNFQEELPAIPVYDLRIKLHLASKIQKAYYAADGATCSFEQLDDGVLLNMRRLDVFEMVVLETEI